MTITLKKALTEMMLEDEFSALSNINESLDHIDLSMPRDDLLSKAVDIWRDRLARWRCLLVHARTSVDYRYSVLNLQHFSAGSEAGVSEGCRLLSSRLGRQQDFLQFTSGRIDTTFQAVAATMGIVESRRAIQQTETVTKLTQLAFFFVPLTYVTGIFGANINVSCSGANLTTSTGLNIGLRSSRTK